MSLRQVAWRIVSVLLTLSLLVFSFLYIRQLLAQININELTIKWAALFISVSLLLVSYLFFSINWFLSSRILSSLVTLNQMLAFIASQPYKYLPTSVFTFSSRAYFGSKLGLTIRQASAAQLFENVSLLTANIYLFFVLSLLYLKLAAGLAVLVFTVSSLYIFYRSGKTFRLKLRNRVFVLSVHEIIKMITVSILGWIFSGLAFIFLHTALGLQANLLLLLAANTIAFSISIITFFAPGGIGVRELVYVKFAVENSAIVLWRILIFIVDMIAGLVAYLIARTKYTQNS